MKKINSAIWFAISIVYMFLIFILFPLIYQDHYYNMALVKWKFYMYTTVGFILITVIYSCFSFAFGCAGKKRKCLTDEIVVCYFVLAVITFLTCPNPMAAWMGTDGWYMGFIAQLLFVVTYWIFSRKCISSAALLIFLYLGSVICFFLAVCQRYGYDLLHLYWDMPAEVVRDYLSTIGNRSWFAGYACAVFPAGIYGYWSASDRKQKVISGSYTFLAFCCIVTMNTDSVYAGLLAVMYVMLLLSIGYGRKLERFLYVLDCFVLSCVCMSVFRVIKPDKIRELRGVSRFTLNLYIALPCLILLFVMTVLIRLKNGKEEKSYTQQAIKKKRKLFVKITLLVFVLLLGTIMLNTSGAFQKLFGFTIQNQYFLFNDEWGDHRGGSWKLTVQMIRDLPLCQKLFGIGQDCFTYHAYSNSQYRSVLYKTWGEAILSNAHNEWLNSLLCMGLLGGTAYLLIFMSAAYQCYKFTANGKEDPLVSGVGFCIIGYIVNNFFGYQQVCAASAIFLLMGAAMGRTKEK